ncbi:Ribokinase [Halotydeus destructor]|nr:Ribokinase [Halotydeus destructor]
MGDTDNVIFMGASIYDLMAYASRFPKPGETLTGHHFTRGCGGKGANACVAAARLGLRGPLLTTNVGDDDFGREMFNTYKDHGIRTDNVLVNKESHSSVGSIWIQKDGQNCLIYIPGVAELLSSEHILAQKATFQNCSLFVSTFEFPLATTLTALQVAKEANVRTMVNAAPPVAGDYDKGLFKLVDILCVNESEAESLTGQAVKTLEDAKAALPTLLALGPDTVIITLGDKGALFAVKTPEGVTVEHVTGTVAVTAVDTTGAGDAFMGALAFFMTRHPQLTFKEHVTRACTYASLTVGRVGTQASYLHKHEVPSSLFE